MIRGSVRALLIIAATAALGACASRPKPMPLAPAEAPRAQAGPAPYAPPPGGEVQEQANAPIVPGSTRDFVINVGDRVYFDYDQFDLKDDAKRLLDAQADWLNRYRDVRVRIEGNCDERGTREYNFALGAQRASAVKDYLVSRGVDPDRIATVSYGKERPIDPGDDEAAWAKNRNAHTAIVGGAPS